MCGCARTLSYAFIIRSRSFVSIFDGHRVPSGEGTEATGLNRPGAWAAPA